MKSLLTILSISLFLSCKKADDYLIILINIKNSAIKKIYFTDAYKWETFLDSATGEAKFTFKIPKQKLPRSLCSICYLDNQNKIKQLEFINHVLSPDSIKYLISAFIPDKDTIKIYGDLKKSPYYLIEAGEETKSLYATQMMNFGDLDFNVSKRTTELENFVTTINRYPTSQYLLSQLYDNRTVIKKKELALLLANFTPASLQSKVGTTLKQYADKQTDTQVLSTMLLEDEKGRAVTMFDSGVKLNMIVLWASWCGPCRHEIPEIKIIESKYKGKGLNIVSVSTDDSKEKWEQAVAKENMPWKQLIVPANSKEQFHTKYEVSSIPDIIFIDGAGKVVERFIGYKDGQSKEYEAVINKFLH